jgi:5-methylcytosine-specific restriction endonuclease McrA
MPPLNDFFSHTPTDSEVWRAIVAFGKNSATYKFAFGRTILKLAADGVTSATAEDLARPFAAALCEHLKHSEKQLTREVGAGSFLATCRDFNTGKVDESQLLKVTAQKGFVNVIEAFQNLPGLDESRFYSGDFRRGITFHDPLLNLAASNESISLKEEIEARWRLVESAWNLNLSPAMILVEMDRDSEDLFLRDTQERRIDLSPSRPALNAYQKGRCFYCNCFISAIPSGVAGSHVDHFLPFKLAKEGFPNVNGIWNLVLACAKCNGPKLGNLPHVSLPERLVRRNNWYCKSKHPLSETIRTQAGKTSGERLRFIQTRYKMASSMLGTDTSQGWLPTSTH